MKIWKAQRLSKIVLDSARNRARAVVFLGKKALNSYSSLFQDLGQRAPSKKWAGD